MNPIPLHMPLTISISCKESGRASNGRKPSAATSLAVASWVPNHKVTVAWFFLWGESTVLQNGLVAWVPFGNRKILGSWWIAHDSTICWGNIHWWAIQKIDMYVPTVLQGEPHQQIHYKDRQVFVRGRWVCWTAWHLEQSSCYYKLVPLPGVFFWPVSRCHQPRWKCLLHGVLDFGLDCFLFPIYTFWLFLYHDYFLK